MKSLQLLSIWSIHQVVECVCVCFFVVVVCFFVFFVIVFPSFLIELRTD